MLRASQIVGKVFFDDQKYVVMLAVRGGTPHDRHQRACRLYGAAGLCRRCLRSVSAALCLHPLVEELKRISLVAALAGEADRHHERRFVARLPDHLPAQLFFEFGPLRAA